MLGFSSTFALHRGILIWVFLFLGNVEYVVQMQDFPDDAKAAKLMKIKKIHGIHITCTIRIKTAGINVLVFKNYWHCCDISIQSNAVHR